MIRQKYNAKKTEVDGIVFASKKEAQRYSVLKVLEKTGIISDLQMQVPYLLIPEQREPEEWVPYKKPVKGEVGRWKPGKVIERRCVYVADFVYEQDGETVVEDVKGRRTKEYILKRKLLLHQYGIRIKET
jgi:hypothetical protein